MKTKSSFIILLLINFVTHAQVDKRTIGHNRDYKKSKLMFEDDFNNGLKNWIAEIPSTQASAVTIKNNKLVVDVDGGATIWFANKLSRNVMITYNRKVIVDGGTNDRLSDLNQFWMTTDPARKNLFTRTGVFSEYDSLLLYYVGFGGNSNTTTRFRKYTGNGERVLLKDLADKAHLLEPNKEYSIKIIVYNGVSKFFVDDKMFFSFKDQHPLTEGYFGFRTTASRQEIDNFKVYELE